MKNFNEGVDRSLKINQSGVDRVEIDDMLQRLQLLSASDRLGLLDVKTHEEVREPALV